MDNDPLGEQHSRVEATEVLQAQETARIDVPHKKPDLVHVCRDQDSWTARPSLRCDQVAKAIDPYVIDEWCQLVSHDCPNPVLETGDSGRAGQPLQEVAVHDADLSSRTIPYSGTSVRVIA
jgi:hypothetical protein